VARGTTKVSRWFGDESQSEASVPTFHNGRFHSEMVPIDQTGWPNAWPAEPVP